MLIKKFHISFDKHNNALRLLFSRSLFHMRKLKLRWEDRGSEVLLNLSEVTRLERGNLVS